MKTIPLGLSGSTFWSTFLVAVLLNVVPTESAVNGKTQCCRCDNMRPTYVPGNVEPQSAPSPFKIIVNRDINAYTANISVPVTLTSIDGQTFRSFMLVAHKLHEKHGSFKALGRFELVGNTDYDIKQDCNHQEKSFSGFAAVSHTRKQVRSLRFNWIPATNYGHIEFRASFVQNDTRFWVREKSRILYDSALGIPRQKNIYTPPINTDECGKTKGCFREPKGCIEPQCYYILTWQDSTHGIAFELGGLTGGDTDSYVAAALSDDTYVGDDTVFICAHIDEYDSTEVYFGKHNDEYETSKIDKYISALIKGRKDRIKPLYNNYLLKEQGSFRDKRLQCRFTVTTHLKSLSSKLKNLGGWHPHIIMSHGLASDGEPRPMGVGYDEFPHASDDEVRLDKNRDYSGLASYPLVKAHGCLMIIAWVLFSSVGFLLAKYYQPMWPEKRVYDRKYWFAGHFKAMTMVFILVVIAVILIFIEADGYTYARDLPYRAHPILGIIIFVCVLILPFIALLRPGKGHDCRNVFNWLYWIFATIANVLAIPNIFIGMNFGKAAVPWWATWILVFWVIFHIIVEITLEIHQCVTHKKNKEKRKKHELLKRDYPKQHHPVPEPAGRRFKRFMLLLHFAVTILITLIMVIIIAVS